MLGKILLTLILLKVSFVHAGISCEVSKRLQQASQSGKLGDKFWSEYARLGSEVKDRELSALLRKHGIETPESSSLGKRSTDYNPDPRVRPQTPKTALRDVDRLSPSLRQKFGEVMEALTVDPSGSLFYKNPGRWHFEKLPQYGANAHSVRLDAGYRVLVDIQDGVATIRAVNKTVAH